jgi:hypothetical protein
MSSSVLAALAGNRMGLLPGVAAESLLGGHASSSRLLSRNLRDAVKVVVRGDIGM